MTLSTCITSSDDGYVIVTEYDDGEQYLPEGSSLTAKNRFEWNDTASVDVFKLNSTLEESYTPVVIIRRDSGKEVRVKLNRDGWFTSIHIVIPTKEWVYSELDKEGSIIQTYDIVYFTDGSDIYTCVGTEVSRSNLDNLLAETSMNTTISRVDSEYFSISFLDSQTANEYKKIIENQMYNGRCASDTCSAFRYLTGTTLIRHYVRLGQLAEAERVLEKLNWFKTETKRSKISDLRRISNCGCRL